MLFNLILVLCLGTLVVTCTAKKVCEDIKFEYCKQVVEHDIKELK